MRRYVFLLALTMACGSDDVALPTDSDGNTDRDTDSDTAEPTVTELGCEPRHEAFIQALEADLAASGAPGVSAAILEDGVVTCRVARGTKAFEGTEPVDVDTAFQLGSTTKMFTAIAALQQVDRGPHTRDATLAELYPEREFALDEGWNDALTLHHLLSNQGGLYDYIDWTRSSVDSDLKSWHDVVLFGQLWLMTPPGELWNYSNPNFTIAGLIVETQDPEGRTYRQVMAEDVFAPLGMTRTVQGNDAAAELGNLASSHGLAIEGTTTVERAIPWEESPDPAHARPAGANTWSTPHDVLLAARFLIEGDPEVLSDTLREQMVDRQADVPDQPTAGYGYGVFVYEGFNLGRPYYETPLWTHGGNTLSYTSQLFVLPEQGVAVSILSSGDGERFDNAVLQALSLAELPPPVAPPERTFDGSRLDLHVGTYEDAYNWGRMIVDRDEDGLVVEMPDLAELGVDVEPRLSTVTDATFVATLNGQSFPFTFVGEEGQPSEFMVSRSAVGTRTDAPQSLLPRDRELRRALPAAPRLGPGPGVELLAR